MNRRRVVITGIGAVSPFGQGAEHLWNCLESGQSAVKVIPEMAELKGLRSCIAATVPQLDAGVIPRQKRRFMSAMSVYSCLAAFEAIQSSGLSGEEIRSPGTGLSLASTMGSSAESEAFFKSLLGTQSIEHTRSTMFFKTMNHSCAANTAQALGIRGRIISSSAACASGTTAIGLGYETIANDYQDIMICGGTDEHHALATAVFDIMDAASCGFNQAPNRTPRPFDVYRDGVVCAEGAGIAVLEEREHAIRHNRRILAEVIGFSMLSSPDIAHPDAETMRECISAAVDNANIHSREIDYINAHATATVQGDIAESQAVSTVIGSKTPVSSLKGHIGHTMAASGPLELIASVQMLERGRLIPTRNLECPDPECGGIDLLRAVREMPVSVVLKNSFALGGINSTIIIKRNNS